MNKNHNIGRDLLATLSENKIKFTVYVFVFFILANIVGYINYLNQSTDYNFKIDINKDYLSKINYDQVNLNFCNDPLESKINDLIEVFIDKNNNNYLTLDHKKLINQLILYECGKLELDILENFSFIKQFINFYVSDMHYQSQIWEKYLVENNLSRANQMPNIKTKVNLENDQNIGTDPIILSLRDIKKANLTINFINFFIDELNSVYKFFLSETMLIQINIYESSLKRIQSNLNILNLIINLSDYRIKTNFDLNYKHIFRDFLNTEEFKSLLLDINNSDEYKALFKKVLNKYVNRSLGVEIRNSDEYNAFFKTMFNKYVKNTDFEIDKSWRARLLIFDIINKILLVDYFKLYSEHSVEDKLSKYKNQKILNLKIMDTLTPPSYNFYMVFLITLFGFLILFIKIYIQNYIRLVIK